MKYMNPIIALLSLQMISALAHEMGDIYIRERVGAFDDEKFAPRQLAEFLGGPEHGQGTF
jgi:hypothetical protein